MGWTCRTHRRDEKSIQNSIIALNEVQTHTMIQRLIYEGNVNILKSPVVNIYTICFNIK
jgi:hypothetical protein